RVVTKCAAQQLHALYDRLGRDHEPWPNPLAQLLEADEVWRGTHERDEQIERQGLQTDDRSGTPHPPRCKVDDQIVDLVSHGIGAEVPSALSQRLGRHGGALCWAISSRRTGRYYARTHPRAPPLGASQHPSIAAPTRVMTRVGAINPRSLVKRRHNRGAVIGVQRGEQRVVYLANGSVDGGANAELPDGLLSGRGRFVLAHAARCCLDANIELGHAGAGAQVEVAEADPDAARRGRRSCPRYRGAEEADR